MDTTPLFTCLGELVVLCIGLRSTNLLHCLTFSYLLDPCAYRCASFLYSQSSLTTKLTYSNRSRTHLDITPRDLYSYVLARRQTRVDGMTISASIHLCIFRHLHNLVEVAQHIISVFTFELWVCAGEDVPMYIKRRQRCYFDHSLASNYSPLVTTRNSCFVYLTTSSEVLSVTTSNTIKPRVLRRLLIDITRKRRHCSCLKASCTMQYYIIPGFRPTSSICSSL